MVTITRRITAAHLYIVVGGYVACCIGRNWYTINSALLAPGGRSAIPASTLAPELGRKASRRAYKRLYCTSYN